MSDKFVFVNFHSSSASDKMYLFQVPSHLELFAGDDVICNTRRGSFEGKCMCDSFVTEKGDEILNALSVDRRTLREVAGFVGGFPPSRFSDPTPPPENVDIFIDELLF